MYWSRNKPSETNLLSSPLVFVARRSGGPQRSRIEQKEAFDTNWRAADVLREEVWKEGQQPRGISAAFQLLEKSCFSLFHAVVLNTVH